MAKLVCLMLVILVLAAICSNYMVDSQRRPYLLKNDCGCKVMKNKKVSCQRIPKSNEEKLQIIKCLCKKHHPVLNKKLSTDFQNACKKLQDHFFNSLLPLPLS